MPNKSFFYNGTYKLVLIGIIGGLGLIISTGFLRNGWLAMIPYPLFLIFAIRNLVQKSKVPISLMSVFWTSFWVFITMTFISYLYVFLINHPNGNINALGHIWRWGAMIGFGIAASLMTVFLFRKAVIKRNKLLVSGY
jgi:hypothetical protein